jgi:hypothetical protein
MEACHILLGRPWQYGTRAIQDCYNNKFSFIDHEKKIVIKSLSPRGVLEDQYKMKEKLLQEKREKEIENEK